MQFYSWRRSATVCVSHTVAQVGHMAKTVVSCFRVAFVASAAPRFSGGTTGLGSGALALAGSSGVAGTCASGVLKCSSASSGRSSAVLLDGLDGAASDAPALASCAWRIPPNRRLVAVSTQYTTPLCFVRALTLQVTLWRIAQVPIAPPNSAPAPRTLSWTGVFTGSAAARVILQELTLAALDGDAPRLRSRYPPTTSPSIRGVELRLLAALAMPHSNSLRHSSLADSCACAELAAIIQASVCGAELEVLMAQAMPHTVLMRATSCLQVTVFEAEVRHSSVLGVTNSPFTRWISPSCNS